MNGNFVYHNPTKLYFGPDSLKGLEEELKKYGPNIEWRYFTNVEMPQLNPVNRVVILFCDGKTEQISITREMVFGEAVEQNIQEEPKPDEQVDVRCHKRNSMLLIIYDF